MVQKLCHALFVGISVIADRRVAVGHNGVEFEPAGPSRLGIKGRESVAVLPVVLDIGLIPLGPCGRIGDVISFIVFAYY